MHAQSKPGLPAEMKDEFEQLCHDLSWLFAKLNLYQDLFGDPKDRDLLLPVR